MVVNALTYEQLALEDADGRWELYDGRLQQKPTMTSEHNQSQYRLGVEFGRHLDPRQFQYRLDNSRAGRPPGSYFIPDFFVVPTTYVRDRLGRPPALEVFDEPLPLVIEVWSPSTGAYDIDTKIPEYKLRGDDEIWRLHPYERALIAWRRQPDGSYTETRYTGGTVAPVALPGVVIDLDALFD